jgi:hypothetical protein
MIHGLDVLVATKVSCIYRDLSLGSSGPYLDLCTDSDIPAPTSIEVCVVRIFLSSESCHAACCARFSLLSYINCGMYCESHRLCNSSLYFAYLIICGLL